jgi:hypothetical protein
MLNTGIPHESRQDIDSMKLVVQIACGILLAGFVSWVFWMTVIVGVVKSVPHTTLDLSHVIRPSGPLVLPAVNVAPPAPPPRADCVNFVQKANGERSCLENMRDSTTLPLTHVRGIR